MRLPAASAAAVIALCALAGLAAVHAFGPLPEQGRPRALAARVPAALAPPPVRIPAAPPQTLAAAPHRAATPASRPPSAALSPRPVEDASPRPARAADPEGVTLTGRVLDASSGAPIENARVEAADASVTTGPDGAFLLEVARGAETIALAAEHLCYRRGAATAAISRGGEAPPPIEIRLEPVPGLASLEVVCRDEAGNRVAAAEIEIETNEETGDFAKRVAGPDGVTAIPLAPGAYMVSATGPADLDDEVYDDAPRVRVSLGAGERRRVDLVLTRLATLRGTFDGPREALFAHVTRPDGKRQVSSIDLKDGGHFEITLPAGHCVVRLRGREVASEERALDLAPGAAIDVAFGVAVVVEPEVRGIVRAAATGQPIARALVSAAGTAAFADAQGRFALRPPDRPSEVVARARGFVTTRVAVPLEAAEIDIALERAGSLCILLRGPGGAPAKSLRVRAVESGGFSASGRTDEEGRYEPFVRRGSYSIYVDDASAPAAQVDVEEDRVAEVEIALPGGGR